MATNPYLEGMAGAITNRATNNLKQNILPGIGGNAMAAGGYGGSRQGIAEGNAIGQTNLGIADSLSNLYGNAYQADQNFYTQQRGLDQTGMQLGANLQQMGLQGQLAQGQGLYNLGLTQQQAPWQATNNASNVFSQYSGLGGSTSQTEPGSRVGGALGGALAGAQLFSNLGLGSTPYTTTDRSMMRPEDPYRNRGYYGGDLGE
jgi:hypothetical protein